ncbi:MAG: PAN domain-containing protein, partial [Cypionkella sp.]|nr:PAN domain-containing protein [Cypionkella sp.]
MRVGFGRALKGVFASLFIMSAMPAAAQDLIPAKRLVLSENTDMPGGDIASIFDTTLEACQRACLTNKLCKAFTFNTSNGSCFPKSKVGETAAFDGAYSGTVLEAEKGAEDRAKARRSDLNFVQDWELAGITDQAVQLANTHTTNGYSAEDHLGAAADAEANGDFALASNYAGAALNLTDSADGWAEYARLLLAAGQKASDRSYLDRAYYASVNAFLRSDNKAQEHTILLTMGDALEATDRGRDKVQALRLAQALQPRDDTALALDDAIGKYGFRIVDNVVVTDTARPRICVNFSEPLAKSGVDYATFVQLPSAGLTVTSDGWQQLCVEGVTFGSRNTLTFREGLPAADGQTLAKSIDVTVYVRDRNPGVRFPGRGYVLPRAGAALIP